jgi:Cft2 family RNA processing exonuclease
MENTLKFVNKMNYGEKYDADSVIFKPMASGHSLGSSLWSF